VAEYPGSEGERRLVPAALLRGVAAIFAACGMSDADARLLESGFERAYERDGIPLNDETLAGIRAAGLRLGVKEELLP
jgi:hypothetical protein